jgi:DNA-binding YbaB/EbfC family protein
MVKVIMRGNHDIKRIEIDPALVREDKEMLEDLIAAAVNDANRRVEKETEGRMSKLASGMNLPPGLLGGQFT